MKNLQKEIKQAILHAGGDWGIIIEDLNERHEAIVINDKQLFAAQSIIKVPIMAEVFAAHEKQQLNLNELITLRREHLVGGTGILQHLSAGQQFSIYDLIVLMIIQSDNTATNILIDLVGFEAINELMASVGMKNSCLNKQLMIYPVTNKDVENYITAADIHLFYKKLATGKIISRYCSEQMISILKKQQILHALPAYLPEETRNVIGQDSSWELANKTGSDTYNQHDVGILYIKKQTVLITILSGKVKAVEALQTIANIGKSIYDFYRIESANMKG